jgi:hypothetical protein
MNDLFEFFHLGTEINYSDGVLLGLISLMYLLIISFTSTQNICERLKENALDKGLFLFFIFTFLSFTIKNTNLTDLVSKKYPLFLSYLELLRYGEIFIFVLFTIILIYLFIIWLIGVIAINGLIILFIAMISYPILKYLIIDFLKIKYFITFDIFFIILTIFLYFSFFKDSLNTIKFNLLFFTKNLYNNLICFLRK